MAQEFADGLGRSGMTALLVGAGTIALDKLVYEKNAKYQGVNMISDAAIATGSSFAAGTVTQAILPSITPASTPATTIYMYTNPLVSGGIYAFTTDAWGAPAGRSKVHLFLQQTGVTVAATWAIDPINKALGLKSPS